MIRRAAHDLYWRVRRRARRSPALFWLVSNGYQLWLDTRHSLPYRLAFARRRLTHPFRRATLVCYPERPIVDSLIFKIAMLNGWSITTDQARRPDFVVAWEDTTARQPNLTLQRLAKDGAVINIGLTDISKRTVDRAFAEAFGYSTFVDPTTHAGPCVCKSDDNALHDGRVITCPIPAGDVEPDKIYQQVLDNTLPDGMVRDIRVPVFGDTIPFAYLKDRPVEDRFSNTNARAAMVELNEVLSSEEVKRLLRFCRLIGMDYGELDTIRDKGDGRLFVVDANSTPSGPPNHLPPAETRKAARILARTFAETMPRYGADRRAATAR